MLLHRQQLIHASSTTYKPRTCHHQACSFQRSADFGCTSHCHKKAVHKVQLKALPPRFDTPERAQGDKGAAGIAHKPHQSTNSRPVTPEADESSEHSDEAVFIQSICRSGSTAELAALLGRKAQALTMVQTCAAIVHFYKLCRQRQGQQHLQPHYQQHQQPHLQQQRHQQQRSRLQSTQAEQGRPNSAGSPSEAELLRLLIRQLQRVTSTLDAQGVANVLWALAKLQAEGQQVPGLGMAGAGGGALLSDLVTIAGARAGEMNARNLSNTLYALALIQQQHTSAPGHTNPPVPVDVVTPSPSPLSALPSSSRSRSSRTATDRPQQQQYQQQQQQQQQLGMPAASLQLLLQSCGQRMYTLDTHALTNTIWAVARLKAQPNAAWLQAFFERSARVMCHMRPRQLVTISWALVQLDAPPPPQWVRKMLRHSQPLLQHASFRELSGLAWALAELHIRPHAAWVLDLCAAAMVPDVAKAADTASVTGLLYALSQWPVQLPDAFLEVLFDHAAPLPALHKFRDDQLHSMECSVRRLKLQAPETWLQAVRRRLEAESAA